MKCKLTPLYLAAALAAALPAHAGDLYVVANAALKVEAGEVREIFVGDKQIAGGVKLVPVDNATAQKDFLEKVVNLDANKYNTIWAKKGFREGLSAPAVKGGDADVLATVRSTPGAIGYVSGKPPAGVLVVHKY